MLKANRLIHFQKNTESILLFGLMIVCWTANYIADIFLGTWLFYLFYHGIFAIVFCIWIPLYIMLIRKNLTLRSIGLNTTIVPKEIIIGLVIAIVTCGSRFFTLTLPQVPTSQIIYIVIAMIFSTLFEEIFFRGILLSRFEKQFGVVIAILLSSLCFSLYHSAQSFIGLDFEALLTLFLVGILFGISYRITNSIITAYIVNLPHAILTFLGDSKYLNYSYENMNLESTIVTAIAIIIASVVITTIKNSKRNKRKFDYKNRSINN